MQVVTMVRCFSLPESERLINVEKGRGKGNGAEHTRVTRASTQVIMESRTTVLGNSFGRPAACLQTEARHIFARKIF